MIRFRIPSPCHQDWNVMIAAGRGRHCAACDKTVVDVAGMGAAEADSFLRLDLPERIARGERVCVHAHATGDGTVRRRPTRRYLLTNGLAAILALAAFGCGSEEQGPSAPTAKSQKPASPEASAPSSPADRTLPDGVFPALATVDLELIDLKPVTTSGVIVYEFTGGDLVCEPQMPTIPPPPSISMPASGPETPGAHH